ncbi:phosphoethanolamine transferase [Acinetobacter baumannii]|uniref:phosphoethanolamine transferase n=1 Tax=Acinetobacter baumannii TaxID=470 RepID=UPI000399CB7B|nr:phosphoethanolamine--lipid A transferase [Acinetobacter baumannii]EHU1603116.1 phosphoethanolamine--lipid A transferase [Acinetobacter baumannii]EJB8411600.1 phosphoethanolamine--lipid A transferase [Acinetobacter baumannii]MCR8954273.1 phosphoethanolamine--lipid A transferase [Acinetobacter baumannii]MDA3519913.1 phosphoethanolamine--lipid A transferase [Acinetobacter baumannii]MDV4248294.1 phosphoethanolamine--lipid A transferase [Acinetobacter baumannii]
MLNFFSTLRNKQISLFMFNLIIAIWLGAILNIGFYKKVHLLTPYLGIKATLFLAATVVIVVATYYAALQILNWKWTAKIFAILLVFIGGFSSYFVNTLGVIISPDQIQNIAQTDVAEATDLLSLRFGLWTIFFVVLPIFLITQVKLKSEKILPLLLKKVLSIALVFAVVGGLLFAYYVDFAAIFREHRDLKGMISPQNTISSVMSYYRKKAPKKNLPLVKYGEDAHQVQQTQKDLPKLMVLVVGETARAESFSLNGYAKNTNPELSKQNILNFSQVSSCGTATAVSVPCMFSGMPRADYDEQLASHREGLLDIAKRAGYQVTWIDNNSGCKGACDRVEQYQIPEDLKQKWCKDGECLDDILIDSLKQYLASIPKDDKRPRLVVLHQMGSHGPAYYKRAPEGYQPFKPTCDTNAIQGCSPAELINSYDNTIVYTDHVLSQMINTLKEVSNYQTGFWYLSDHGESTGEHGMYLHGSPYSIAPSQQTHIPMIMWFSDGWKQNNLAQVNCLNQQTKQKLSQDNLFPSLLSMLDVKTQVINPQLDMLHSCANVN